jgi:ubiquinone/menaquinone biosynthesis C-methylase UbiE
MTAVLNKKGELMTPNYQNPDNLRHDQYKDSSNLNARIVLHRQFTIAEQAWLPWVFDQIALQPGEQVLECGGGPGWLWRENLDRIPAGCHITFTDLSPGMVAEAQAALAHTADQFTFQTVNIMELPFEENSFDVVVANHMLYHVPDRPRALSEIKRVLKENGRFLAATNGKKHFREIRELGQDLLPLSWLHAQEPTSEETPIARGFRLEDGRAQLQPFFSQVELRPYRSHLAVTEVEPLINYILSSSEARKHITPERRQRVADHIQQIITTKGHFHITKESGIFVARP